jgi:CRP-like cAMP-binding protein
MNGAEARTVLADLPLLAGATDADLDRIQAWSEACRFAAGDLLLRRGGAADRLHVVLEGRVVLSLHAAGRGDLTVETLGPGDVVGVSWAVPPHRWGLDARAADEVRTLAVDGVRLRAVTSGDDPLGPVVLRGIARLLAERLAATRLRLVDLYDPRRPA